MKTVLVLVLCASLAAETVAPAADAVEADAVAMAETVELAGLRLEIPPGLVAVAESPAGVLALWRSADGTAAIGLVERPVTDAEPLAVQVAALLALGQDVVIELDRAPAPGERWHRLRYQLTLGRTRFVQAARIATLPDPSGARQVVVTANWPLDATARWDATLSAALESLAVSSE
jgi:hypothetical protein